MRWTPWGDNGQRSGDVPEHDSAHAYADLMLCPHCDEVYQRKEMAPDEASFCIQCGSRLGHRASFSVSSWLAWTVTAGCLFVFANTFPVALISFDGLDSQATIWQSITSLAQGVGVVMAAAAGAVVILVPGSQIALLLWLLSFAVIGKACPGFVLVMRCLRWIRPWGMTEVFLLGVLVAVIKMSSYLHVIVGMGVFCMAFLAPLMVIITSHGTDDLWRLYGDRDRLQ